MRSHKWTLPAIIPHIPTNKPSSSEVTFGTAETIMSTDAEDLFTVLHRFCKCLSETIFGIMLTSSIYIKKKVLKKFYFHTRKRLFFTEDCHRIHRRIMGLVVQGA